MRCFVALGANLGEPIDVVRQALEALRAMAGVRAVTASSLYRSAPVGLLHQPDFINAVACLDVDEIAVPSASTLLDQLFAIEARFGRQRSVRNAPRTLDLDLLTYGDTMSADPACTVPHPRLHERAFVLAPLLEIAPDMTLPGQPPLAELLTRCAGQRLERLP